MRRLRGAAFAFFPFVWAAAVSLAPAAGAAPFVPGHMSYQGILTAPDGTPLDGPVTLDLALFPFESGGVAAWTDTLGVEVENGVFQVELGGTGNPLPVLSQPFFLEVAVDGETLAPRQPLASVPFALRAQEANTLGGRTAGQLDQSVQVNEILGNPVLELEDLLSRPAADIVELTGELVLQGGNVPLTVVDGFVGLNVQAALQDGVRARSVDDTGFGFAGLFLHDGPTGNLGTGVYTRGNQGAAPDLVLGANDGSASGDDGRIASDPAFPSSDIVLDSQDDVFVELDTDDSGDDASLVVRGPDGTLFRARTDGTVSFPQMRIEQVSVSNFDGDDCEKGNSRLVAAGFCALVTVNRLRGGEGFECRAAPSGGGWNLIASSTPNLVGSCGVICRYACF